MSLTSTDVDSKKWQKTSESSFKSESPKKKSQPLASEDETMKDSNIQFVEVQTLLFGENPAPLNPKTITLKNHEPTKASQKKCGIIKSYAANTN